MTPINDPNYWSHLARKIFAEAKIAADKSLRGRLFLIAVAYTRLAEWTQFHSASVFWNAELIYGRKRDQNAN